MQFDHYQKLYSDFNAEFFPDATLEEVELKMLEEMGELAAELSCEGILTNKIYELLDVMNMSIKLLDRYGVKDPLHAGAEKLRLTAEKYRKAAEGVTGQLLI